MRTVIRKLSWWLASAVLAYGKTAGTTAGMTALAQEKPDGYEKSR